MEKLMSLQKLRKSYLILLIAIVPILGRGQILTSDPANIRTPNDSLAKGATKNRTEHSPADLAYLNQYYDLTYSNALKLDSATRTYNCHGYAWHMSSNSNTEAVVISGGNPHPVTGLDDYEDIYWTSGSYIEVCTPIASAKVSYQRIDHSAITTADPQVFISKWGDDPLV